jgi:hypothetical protein
MKYFKVILLLILFSCNKDIPPITTKDVITKVIVTPPSTSTSIFNGYKVNKNQNTKEYWDNTIVMNDLMATIFQPQVKPEYPITTSYATNGDFNNDGFIDIFNPPMKFNKTYTTGFSFLIWDTITKTYVDQNLFTNVSSRFFGANVGNNKSIPFDLNKDGYVDIILFDNGDEGDPNSPNEPIRIVLSDGTGKYTLQEIETDENELPVASNRKEGGDVGDIDGDGIPDLIIAENTIVYIYKGINSFPFFTTKNRVKLVNNSWSWYIKNANNGFGENCSQCTDMVFDITINDINKDGKNDIIEQCKEVNGKTSQRILINQGQGRFNDNGIIKLPMFDVNINMIVLDYVIDDLNNDGLKDMIVLGTTNDNYQNSMIYTYIQNKPNEYIIDKSWIVFNNINPFNNGNIPFRLIYNDFNNDGIKDLTYRNTFSNTNSLPSANILLFKSVFIRQGNQFIEKPYYQYDTYADSLQLKYFKH